MLIDLNFLKTNINTTARIPNFTLIWAENNSIRCWHTRYSCR